MLHIMSSSVDMQVSKSLTHMSYPNIFVKTLQEHDRCVAPYLGKDSSLHHAGPENIVCIKEGVDERDGSIGRA